MCQCTLCADRFLSGLLDTAAFADYCSSRLIGLPAGLHGLGWGETTRWWAGMLRGLPDRVRAQVEWEQLAVPELATPSGYLHLLAAAGRKGLPPAGVHGCLPGVLRFLLDQPSVFREVYSRHCRREPNVWRATRAAAGLPLPEPGVAEERLAAGLGRLYGEYSGQRDGCAVAVHLVPGAVYVSARPAAAASPPAPPAFAEFLYFPADGTVLLRSPVTAAERARELLDCVFGAAFGAPPKELRPGFALDRLKEQFRPLPDADDVLSVRVTALHLRYPGRAGGELRLQTLASDSPSAVEELLRAHGGRRLDELQVAHAELQFRVRIEGCEKTRLVRLWPDRCDAGQGPFRTRVLACLRSWGL